jgi:hypothetical protein
MFLGEYLCSPRKCFFLGQIGVQLGLFFFEEMVVCPHECNHVPKEMLMSLANTTICLVKEIVVFPKKMFDLKSRKWLSRKCLTEDKKKLK